MIPVPHILRFLVCIGTAVFLPSAFGRPGDPDFFFGPANGQSAPGTVVTPLSPIGAASINSLAVQKDGRIIAAGSVGGTTVVLIRYLPDGSLDPAFGTGGKVQTQLPNQTNFIASAVALQADGKIVVTANRTWERVTTVMRHLTDGSPDLSFGEAGTVLLESPPGSVTSRSITVLNDGKLLIGGAAYPVGGDPFGETRLWRLHPDGSPDRSFGVAGNSAIRGAPAEAMAVQPDGKIVVTGAKFMDNTQRTWIARCDADGVLDPSFGEGGTVTAAALPSMRSQPASIAVQSDGKIVLAGTAASPPNEADFLLARFQSNGSPDLSFNGTGIVIKNIPAGASSPNSYDQATALAVLGDGKLLVAGAASERFALLRYLPDGRLDSSFGTNGLTVTRVQQGACSISALALQPDGRILGGGSAINTADHLPSSFAVARYISSDFPLDFSAELPGGLLLKYGQSMTVGRALLPNVEPQEITLTLRNTGTATLTGISARLAGAEASHFSVSTAPPPVLAAGASATLTLQFTPSPEVSNFKALLVIEAGSPVTSTLPVWVHGGTEVPAATLALYADGERALADSIVALPPVVSGQSVTKELFLQNVGNIDLTLQGVSLGNGGEAAEFAITQPAESLLAPNANTSFTVTFTPVGPGLRTARLRVASTDSFNPPLEVNLTGRFATAGEAWRLKYFNTALNEYLAYDLADPDNDGIPNILEFATLSDPLKPGGNAPRVALNGNTLEYTITRPSNAAAEVSCNLQWSDSPETEWQYENVSVTVLSDDGIRQEVRFSTPAGNAGKRFLRLRVQRQS